MRMMIDGRADRSHWCRPLDLSAAPSWHSGECVRRPIEPFVTEGHNTPTTVARPGTSPIGRRFAPTARAARQWCLPTSARCLPLPLSSSARVRSARLPECLVYCVAVSQVYRRRTRALPERTARGVRSRSKLRIDCGPSCRSQKRWRWLVGMIRVIALPRRAEPRLRWLPSSTFFAAESLVS